MKYQNLFKYVVVTIYEHTHSWEYMWLHIHACTVCVRSWLCKCVHLCMYMCVYFCFCFFFHFQESGSIYFSVWAVVFVCLTHVYICIICTYGIEMEHITLYVRMPTCFYEVFYVRVSVLCECVIWRWWR